MRASGQMVQKYQRINYTNLTRIFNLLQDLNVFGVLNYTQ